MLMIMLRRGCLMLFCAANIFMAANANALLAMGAVAPVFTAQSALAGKPVTFDLSAALKRGSVVLYFYPKAFTSGCTVEAHLFAEASEEFAKYQATVIGISNDDIDTLKKFSVEACRNKFAVGADPEGKIIKAYDVQLLPGINTSKRASYVITPDGKVLFVYSSMSPKEHVSKTLEAVKSWKNSPP